MSLRHFCCIGILFCLALATVGPSATALQRASFPRSHRPGMEDDAPPMPGSSPSSSRKMLKASYEQLQKDVQHLSEMAADLKEQVMETDDEDVLSLSGVKKAEEIEKLAKKIQNRMKNL